MTTIDTTQTPAPIGLGPGEGEPLWFLGALTTIKASGAETGGRAAVTEHLAPRGAGSPLHIHTRENEWFYVLEGELTVWIGGETIVASAGSFAFGPQDTAHTFIVSSAQARFLLVTEPAGFEEFVRAIGEPAPRLEIPPAATEPSDIAALTSVAASHGLQIIGPPGIPA